ncbi:MAG: dipeptidase [Phycisphaeraceae bacterium]|nr:dipeptidase [Phycisphaeraceae bacterium]
MPTTADMEWFDAHLDLAYLAEIGRDMHAPLSDCLGRLQPAAVTLPSLRDGSVRACLGTIFTEATTTATIGASVPYAYPHGDAEAAHRAGVRQLRLYHAWRDAGAVRLMHRRPPAAAKLRTTGSVHPGFGPGVPGADRSSSPLLLGILMECADPITTPDELEWWAEQGVVAVGMAWWRGSRYAGGNGSGEGLSDAGRTLARLMDDLGIVHDLTHLSQRATDELLSLTDRPVIASHSNCRSLLDDRKNPDWQRHLADDTIREIAGRGGMIGVNLVRNFIRANINRSDPHDRPSVDDLVDHVERIADIAGSRRSVGLGSDMDGGIAAHDLPRGIDSPTDLRVIAAALTARGWSDEDTRAFAWDNWARFWNLDRSA